MGWLWFNKPTNVTAVEWFKDKYNNSSSGKYEVLDVAVVKLRTLYAAVRYKETGEVWAAVYLLGYAPNDYYNFGYKDMDETMGPCESECPERILKLLTPTDNKYANEWRQRCRANIEKRKAKPKVTNGCRIKFEHAMSFTNGKVLDEFSVWIENRKVTFEHHGTRYRINKWREMDYKIVG